MRAFRCPHCGSAVAFEQQCCFGLRDGGGIPQTLDVDRARPGGRKSTTIDDAAWVRCANWDQGCNWLVEADSTTGVCFADGFVRTGPDPDDTEAQRNWPAL